MVDEYRERVLTAASALGYEVVSNNDKLILRRKGRRLDDTIIFDGTRMISRDCDGVNSLKDYMAKSK